ncbi:MAG: hypothetical protein ACK5OB_04095 [Pirellula sp.]
MTPSVHRISLAKGWQPAPSHTSAGEPASLNLWTRTFQATSGLLAAQSVRLRAKPNSAESPGMSAIALNDTALPLRSETTEYDWEIAALLRASNRIAIYVAMSDPTLFPFDVWLEVPES